MAYQIMNLPSRAPWKLTWFIRLRRVASPSGADRKKHDRHSGDGNGITMNHGCTQHPGRAGLRATWGHPLGIAVNIVNVGLPENRIAICWRMIMFFMVKMALSGTSDKPKYHLVGHLYIPSDLISHEIPLYKCLNMVHLWFRLSSEFSHFNGCLGKYLIGEIPHWWTTPIKNPPFRGDFLRSLNTLIGNVQLPRLIHSSC